MRRGARRDRPAAFRPPSEALTGNPARAEHEPVEPVPADAGRAAIEQADVQRGADVPRHLDEAVATDNPGTGSPVDGEVVNLHVPRREQGTDPFEGWAVTRDPHTLRFPADRREKLAKCGDVGDLGARILAEQHEVARRYRRCPESLDDAGIGNPFVPVFRKLHHDHGLSAPDAARPHAAARDTTRIYRIGYQDGVKTRGGDVKNASRQAPVPCRTSRCRFRELGRLPMRRRPRQQRKES